MELPTKDKYPRLHKRTTEFWHVVYECRKYYLYCYRLHKAETELEQEYLNGSRFFRTTAHVFWRTLVIEVAKLFSDRDGDVYNVQKFIRALNTDPEFKIMGIDTSNFARWDEFVCQNKPLIDTIMGLRNRYYEHTDTPEKKAQVDHQHITIDMLEPLISMAESIIKEIHQLAFDSDTSFRVEYDERDFKIIAILAEHKQERLRQIISRRAIKDK